MIVGNGLLAKAFKSYQDNNDILVFASGVSNSKEVDIKAFNREKELLIANLNFYGKNKKFIYFSTCSMFDSYFIMSDYTKHKKQMEKIITKYSDNYNIFRLPQVLGKNNQGQLIGFLYNVIKNRINFDLFNIERNIIDIKDVFFIINIIINKNFFTNEIINIANPTNIKVLNLVHIIENICKEKAQYNIIDKEGKFEINIENIQSLISEYNIFEKNYLEDRIKKYYE